MVRIKPQMGPLITDSFGLSADGKHLVEKVHVDQYELPAVTITRTYNPTSETGPRPLLERRLRPAPARHAHRTLRPRS